MNTPNTAPQLPPPIAVLQMLTGKWISQAISTAAELGIADQLSGAPKSVADLATASRTDARSLLGLLRALASVGVFAETGDARFVNTPLSEVLRAQVPGSLRALALFLGDQPSWNAWGALPYTIRTGKCAFEHVNGAPAYRYFAEHAATTSYFDEAFTANSQLEIGAILEAYDFSKIHTLADIGGGLGSMLCAVLAKNPSQRGILFDQPNVVAGAGSVIAAAGVAQRCEVVGGDFFVSVPSGADAYLLKHVVFNWNDEKATALLGVVRRAMPASGRLLIIDPVIVPGPGQTIAKFMDLEMMVLYDGGCQRTEAEFAAVLRSAGFKISRIVPTEAPMCSVIEAVPG